MRKFEASVLNNDNTNGIEFGIFLDPTITDPSGRVTYTTINATSSVLEYADPADTVTRATVTGGHPLRIGHAAGGRNAGVAAGQESVPLTADIAGTSSVVVLAARSASGTPTCRASLGATEIA